MKGRILSLFIQPGMSKGQCERILGIGLCDVCADAALEILWEDYPDIGLSITFFAKGGEELRVKEISLSLPADYRLPR
jgi:hypothetical protein